MEGHDPNATEAPEGAAAAPPDEAPAPAEHSIDEDVKAKIKEAAPGPGDVASTVETVVHRVLVPLASGDPAELTEAVAAAMSGVIDAAKDVPPVWHAARGAVLGTLRATSGAPIDSYVAIEHATAALVERSDATGGDFGAAAKGAVEGAILGAEAVGLDDEKAASAAATAGWETARKRSEAAGERVKHVVHRQVMGVRSVVRGLPL